MLRCFSPTFRSLLRLMGLVFIHILEFVGAFTASPKIVQQIHGETASFLGLFQRYHQKSNFPFCDVPKTGFPTHRLSHRLDFFAESVKSPIFASYAGNKKTMIVITIAFVSGIPAAHMPESLNAEMSHVHHAQGSLISVVCRSSDLSIHVQTILLHKRIVSAFSRSHDSSSNDRFSPHAGCVLHGKQHFRITATFGSLPRCLLTAEPASFRVRDSHPIPLFSEQECVSEGFSAT